MKCNKTLLLSTILCLFTVSIWAVAGHTQSYISSLKTKKESGQKLTATEALYLKYCLNKIDSLNIRFNEGFVDWKVVVSQISLVEKQMQSKGYTTFMHARSWEWNFLNDVWNMICAIRDKKATMSDRISLRQRDNACNIKELYQFREELLADGAWCDSGIDEIGKSAELTFLNRTIFSNLQCEYECTAQFLLENASIASQGKALQYALQLLGKYGLSKYASAIKKLYELHKTLSDKGELLCLCVKNDFVDTMIYVAKPFGYKYDEEHFPKQVAANIAHHEQSVDTKEKYYDDGWFGCQLYCAACTDIPGEYDTKYTIKSVNFANAAKYQKYKAELQKLFEKIKKELKIK